MKQCRPLAQALVEAKAEIEMKHAKTQKRDKKKTNKEKKQQTYESL